MMKKQERQHEAIIFIDFEASGLSSENFPISLAWGSEFGRIEHHIISNIFSSDWDCWCEVAEEVHGMSQDFIKKEGLHPLVVCNLILKDLRGKTIYSYGASFDRFWLERLFDWSGEKIHHGIIIKEVVAETPKQRRQLELLEEDVLSTHSAKKDVENLISIFAQ